MKAWKYMILVGGLAGVIGFFLPLFHAVHQPSKFELGLSGFEIAHGVDKKAVVDEVKRLGGTHENGEQFVKELNDGLATAGAAVIIFFTPAAVLAVLGIFGLLLKRFGRLAGLVSFLLGGVSAGIWGVLFSSAGKVADTNGAKIGLAIGSHTLLIAGICGVLAGFGALVAPDRG